MLFFCFFILLILSFTLFFLNFSSLLDSKDKGSSFECGFSSICLSSLVFSMPFFMVSVMFLLFDVEILVLCFFPFSVFSGYTFIYYMFIISFLIFVSTLYEWLKGVLSWF